jgi:DICT domain-containing protein
VLKNFSIFKRALRFSDDHRMENLGEIATISRRDFAERESFRFRTETPGVEYACLMIENALLLRTNRAGRVYAGFEKLSCMHPIVDRYLRIADVSEVVYIFGEPDWKPPSHPNIRLVNLGPDFRLAREWFLIAESPTLHVALVALDEDGFSTPAVDRRSFSAVKTSNPDAVARLALTAEGLIDWSLAA